MGIGRAPGILSVSSESIEEFLIREPKYIKFEEDWWSSLLTTKSVHLDEDSPLQQEWDPVCRLASAVHDISPRYIGYMYSLGLLAKDKASYLSAVRALRPLPSYVKISNYVAGNPT